MRTDAECFRHFYMNPNHQQTHEDNSPVDDLLVLPSDEVLLVWRDDAQGVLLARLGLGVDDVRAEVHVDGALRQRARLEEKLIN